MNLTTLEYPPLTEDIEVAKTHLDTVSYTHLTLPTILLV